MLFTGARHRNWAIELKIPLFLETLTLSDHQQKNRKAVQTPAYLQLCVFDHPESSHPDIADRHSAALAAALCGFPVMMWGLECGDFGGGNFRYACFCLESFV